MSALDGRVAIGNLPMGDCFDLFLAEADVAAGLAMLREDELRAAREAGTDLSEFTQFRIELAVGAPVELETFGRMFEGIRHQREDGPSVAGRTCRRAGFLHRVSVAEQYLVELLREGVRIRLRNLSQSRHAHPPVAWRRKT